MVFLKNPILEKNNMILQYEFVLFILLAFLCSRVQVFFFW